MPKHNRPRSEWTRNSLLYRLQKAPNRKLCSMEGLSSRVSLTSMLQMESQPTLLSRLSEGTQSLPFTDSGSRISTSRTQYGHGSNQWIISPRGQQELPSRELSSLELRLSTDMAASTPTLERTNSGTASNTFMVPTTLGMDTKTPREAFNSATRAKTLPTGMSSDNRTRMGTLTLLERLGDNQFNQTEKREGEGERPAVVGAQLEGETGLGIAGRKKTVANLTGNQPEHPSESGQNNMAGHQYPTTTLYYRKDTWTSLQLVRSTPQTLTSPSRTSERVGRTQSSLVSYGKPYSRMNTLNSARSYPSSPHSTSLTCRVPQPTDSLKHSRTQPSLKQLRTKRLWTKSLGGRHGMPPQRPSPLLFRGGRRSLKNMSSIYEDSSTMSSLACTEMSSDMTRPYGNLLDPDAIFSTMSSTGANAAESDSDICSQVAQTTRRQGAWDQAEMNFGQKYVQKRSVEGLMRESARDVIGDMSAHPAEERIMAPASALRTEQGGFSELPAGQPTVNRFSLTKFSKTALGYGPLEEGGDGEDLEVEDEVSLEGDDRRSSWLPRYLRGWGFRAGETPEYSRTAWFTEIDSPLPRPPLREFEGIEWKTISKNPHLFRVGTPVDAEKLSSLLVNHPNQAFVQSVVTVLKEGLWPWANSKPDETYPETWDNAWAPLPSEKERNFINSQCELEVEAERHSPSFGPDLLPGMYSTPVIAVPKPRSEDLRLVANQSAGRYCQNSMVNRTQTRGARLDNLLVFIPQLLAFKKKNPNKKLVLWKSDVSSAFRLVPVHPLWQIKQVVTAGMPTKEEEKKGGWSPKNLRRYVDWRACFGNSGSVRVWASVIGLVVWFAIFELHVETLCCYVDDCYGVGDEEKL
ncbi:hypothetical protein DFH05DRAFT_151983 [Lentinula detonsa]|uniref:Reverse transcriptase domain-containing protein n=1 Tax=Lentinula detonsa TaxID=2804962 RepID=A0A9W8PBX8_9AGAR|nr:hypothetical protein DFH05DRAFT_151983 [Lentinula detonsa]